MVSGTPVNYVGAPDNRIRVVVNQILTPQDNYMILVLEPNVSRRPSGKNFIIIRLLFLLNLILIVFRQWKYYSRLISSRDFRYIDIDARE